MRRLFRRGGAITACSLLLFWFLLMAGCAATKIQQVWTDESYQGGRLNSVFIVVQVFNPTARMTFESEFAKQLSGRGIKAVESFRSIEMETLKGNDLRDAVVAKMRELKSDAVLLTRVVDHREKVEIIPGMTLTAGYGYGGAYAGASYVFGGPSAPTTQSYSHEQKFLGLQTSLFSATTEKLLWSVQSETRINKTEVEEIGPYVSIISGELLREAFFR